MFKFLKFDRKIISTAFYTYFIFQLANLINQTTQLISRIGVWRAIGFTGIQFLTQMVFVILGLFILEQLCLLIRTIYRSVTGKDKTTKGLVDTDKMEKAMKKKEKQGKNKTDKKQK